MRDDELKCLPLPEREIAIACGAENVAIRRRGGGLALVIQGIRRFVCPWEKQVSLRIERGDDCRWKCRLDLVYAEDGTKTARVEKSFFMRHSDLLRMIEMNNISRAEDAAGLIEDLNVSIPFKSAYYGNWRTGERAIRHQG